MTSIRYLVIIFVLNNLVFAQNKSTNYVSVNYGLYSFYTNNNILSTVTPTYSTTPLLSINLYLQDKISFNAKLGYINHIFHGSDQFFTIFKYEVGMKEYFIFMRFGVEIFDIDEFVLKINGGGYVGAIDAYTTHPYNTLTYNKTSNKYEKTHSYIPMGVSGGVEGLYSIPHSSILIVLNIDTHSAFRQYDYFIPTRFGFLYSIGLGTPI